MDKSHKVSGPDSGVWSYSYLILNGRYHNDNPGVDLGEALGAQAPLTTKNEALAPKFYKIKAQNGSFRP